MLFVKMEWEPHVIISQRQQMLSLCVRLLKVKPLM